MTAVLLVSAVACGGSTVSVSLSPGTFEPQGFAGLSVSWTEGGRTRVMRAADFVTTPSNGTPHVPAFDAGERGTAELGFTFSIGGDVVSSGSIEVDLQPSSGWVFHLSRESEEPFGCFSCERTERFSIAAGARRDPGDAIWIQWGGSPRTNETF